MVDRLTSSPSSHASHLGTDRIDLLAGLFAHGTVPGPLKKATGAAGRKSRVKAVRSSIIRIPGEGATFGTGQERLKAAN